MPFEMGIFGQDARHSTQAGSERSDGLPDPLQAILIRALEVADKGCIWSTWIGRRFISRRKWRNSCAPARNQST